MGSSGKGGSGSTSEVRFAPYVEYYHEIFLNRVENYVSTLSGPANSPYKDYTELDFAASFFGAGYVISDFPSLYDMFGKFMAGLDVEDLFVQDIQHITDNAVVSEMISAHAEDLSDDLENDVFPRFLTGMRDINSVISSSFIIGKLNLESRRVREVSKFSAELRYKLLPIAAEVWRNHLEWNKSVILTYAQLMKLWFVTKIDIDNHNFEIEAKDILWPFTVHDYQRAALGALTGTSKTETDVAGASKAGKVIGSAMTGAAAGSMVGGGTGAVVGGILGMATALF